MGSWGNHFGSISGVMDQFGGPLDGSKDKFGPFWGRFWPFLTPPCQLGQIFMVPNALILFQKKTQMFRINDDLDISLIYTVRVLLHWVQFRKKVVAENIWGFLWLPPPPSKHAKQICAMKAPWKLLDVYMASWAVYSSGILFCSTKKKNSFRPTRAIAIYSNCLLSCLL